MGPRKRAFSVVESDFWSGILLVAFYTDGIPERLKDLLVLPGLGLEWLGPHQMFVCMEAVAICSLFFFVLIFSVFILYILFNFIATCPVLVWELGCA